jgi:hypothetical protein
VKAGGVTPGGSAAPSKPDELVVEVGEDSDPELPELCEEAPPHPALVASSAQASIAGT